MPLTLELQRPKALLGWRAGACAPELRVEPLASRRVCVVVVVVSARTRSHAFGDEAVLLVLADEREGLAPVGALGWVLHGTRRLP